MHTQLLATLVGAGIVCGSLVALARWWRGPRALLAARLAALSVTLSVVAVIYVGVRERIEGGTTIDLLGLLGSAFWGFLASPFLRARRRMTVAIAIPSRKPFHRDLRVGLSHALQERRFDIRDYYDSGAEEDLTDFLPMLGRVSAQLPDAVVICAPSRALADHRDTIALCKKLVRRGGLVYFVESHPPLEHIECLPNVVLVRANSSAGSEIIAQYVARECGREGVASDCVLVLAGPSHSLPAYERACKLKQQLPGATIYEGLQTWESDEAYKVARSLLRERRFSWIVCGNDSMANGVMRALKEARISGTRVVGFDGIYEMVVLIADVFSPATATIRLPPSAYGAVIGNHLCSTRARHIVGHSFEHLEIAVSPASLVTTSNAPSLLGAR
jgi:ABC-type sugar transport system substrate-binding protein